MLQRDEHVVMKARCVAPREHESGVPAQVGRMDQRFGGEGMVVRQGEDERLFEHDARLQSCPVDRQRIRPKSSLLSWRAAICSGVDMSFSSSVMSG